MGALQRERSRRRLAFVRQAIQARGWTTRRAGRALEIPAAGIRLELASFGLLRNVTLRRLDALKDELREPLWLMSRNIDAIVEVVQRFLFA